MMRVVLGLIFTAYLGAFIVVILRQKMDGFKDVLGGICATATIVAMGLFMWRGVLLP